MANVADAFKKLNDSPVKSYNSIDQLPSNRDETLTPTSTSQHQETIATAELADREAEEFIQKYGDIEVSYIDPPRLDPWFTRPYALNYFHNGRLFRTKFERTSGKLELFLDLVYVGIVSNLASDAIRGHSWYSFVKYVLVFLPAFTIWADLKELMNYYFNDDLIQRTLILWEVILLVIYNSNVLFVDSDDLDISNHSLLVSVGCYVVGRLSFAGILMFYSIFIKEHNFQMKLFSAGLVLTSALWFIILLIDDLRFKAIYAAFLYILEQTVFCLSVHPAIKKLLKLEYSTALNIEHEDERYHAFYIISIGEFLYGLCAGSPLRFGFNAKLSKGISLVLISFIFLGIYTHKDGSLKAIHALRRSATSSMVFIYSHLILIASLLIVGDAGADLAKIESSYLTDDEFGILLFFHTGLLTALLALLGVAYSDKDQSPPGSQKLNRYWRTGTRIPIGLFIFGSSWLYRTVKLTHIMWIDAILFVSMFIYEFIVMNPLNFGKGEEGDQLNVLDA